MLANAADLKRWKKVFHAAISSTALNFPVKTAQVVAHEGNIAAELWNETAKIIEAFTGEPFARMELLPNEQLAIKDGGDWRDAFDLLGELAGRPETSTDLRWRLNWMRDFMFAMGLSPKRIEHEARSGKGLWWAVLRKRKENLAVLDAKQLWGRQLELEENQREQRHIHERKHTKNVIVMSKDGVKFLRAVEEDCPDRAFSTRDIQRLNQPPPGHRAPTVWKGHKGLGLLDYTELRRIKLKGGSWELIFGQKQAAEKKELLPEYLVKMAQLLGSDRIGGLPTEIAITITRPIAEVLVQHKEFLPPWFRRILEKIGRYYKINTRPNFLGPCAPGPFGDPHDGTAMFLRGGGSPSNPLGVRPGRKDMAKARAKMGPQEETGERGVDGITVSVKEILDTRDEDEAAFNPVNSDRKID
jgi:hypothetical protein